MPPRYASRPASRPVSDWAPLPDQYSAPAPASGESETHLNSPHKEKLRAPTQWQKNEKLKAEKGELGNKSQIYRGACEPERTDPMKGKSYERPCDH